MTIISPLIAPQLPSMARGELNTIYVDWGVKTDGQETGVLKAGDTVASCVITVDDKPTGAADPTLGTVTVNATALKVNRRSCAAGEATSNSITMASNQAAGTYQLKLVATTTNGKIIPRFVRISLDVPTVDE
jgi:hypothetical protein